MKVSDVMIEEVISIEPEDTVARAITLMLDNRIHQLPIVEGKLYRGMVYAKNLITTNVFPRKTKVQTLAVKTPHIAPDASIPEASQTILGSGLRAVPVISREKLVGIIGEKDLAVVADVGNALVDDVMVGAIVAEEDSALSYALSNMKKQNVSRLPVISSNGRLVGVLDTLDIAKILKVPKERMSASRTTVLSAGADRLDLKSVKVGEIMHKAIAARMGTRLSEAMKLLDRADEIIVTESDMPAGIIGPKDIIKMSIPASRGPVLLISHVEDASTKQEIATELNKFLKKIAGRFDRVSLEVSVDRHRTRKYSMHGKLITEEGVIAARAAGWDARSASKELVTRLDRRIGQYKPDRRRGPSREEM